MPAAFVEVSLNAHAAVMSRPVTSTLVAEPATLATFVQEGVPTFIAYTVDPESGLPLSTAGVQVITTFTPLAHAVTTPVGAAGLP